VSAASSPRPPGHHGAAGHHQVDGRHGAGGPPEPMPAELAALLAVVVPPDGRLGHREHVHLTYLAIQRHGPERAAGLLDGWIRYLTTAAGAPQKYHATVTRAWARLVAVHASQVAPGTSFGEFAAAHPGLLDKRLLNRHYTARRLAAPDARVGWADPDLSPLPG
jgi:hypothetical protein